MTGRHFKVYDENTSTDIKLTKHILLSHLAPDILTLSLSFMKTNNNLAFFICKRVHDYCFDENLKK